MCGPRDLDKMDNRELDRAVPEARRLSQVEEDGLESDEEDDSEVPRCTLEYVLYILH